MAEMLGFNNSEALHPPPLQAVQNHIGWAAEQCCCRVFLWRPRHGGLLQLQKAANGSCPSASLAMLGGLCYLAIFSERKNAFLF